MRVDADQQIIRMNKSASSSKGSESEQLPDVSVLQKTQFAGTLSQVGMGKIEMPILFVANDGTPLQLPAEVDAFVSLDDPEAKGIHMSRLYLEVKSNLRMKPLTAISLKELLQKFLHTHEGLSQSAYITIKFTLPLERKALVSGEMGYRQYPVIYRASLKQQKFDFSMSTEVTYSSTCPCSAALARQLVKQDFLTKFGTQESVNKNDVLEWLEQERGMAATPHAQRSIAKLDVRLQQGLNSPSVMELIDRAEKALGTPVQAAVKRADEQEFARLNAQNLMFCEDAARKLKNLFETDPRITDYSIYVEHQESLHPHNAVSKVSRGEPF